jgi:hypothetical protein
MGIASGMGSQLLIYAILGSVLLSSGTVSSQSTSCDIAPSSDWNETEDPGDYLSLGVPGYGNDIPQFGFGSEVKEDSKLKPLDKDVSTEWSDGAWAGFPGIHVENGSATTLSMVLEPGKRYTFCIDFSSKGDVYLMTDANLDMYTVDFYCDEDGWELICDEGGLDSVPVEYRDMFTWVPFRDAHAYESVSYQEFSVAIDSDGSAWSFAGFGGSDEQVLHLVLDGWDNSREGDHPASGNMSVEVLIDVEERFTLPKTAAYILIGSLPLSCVIVPLIIHWKYHSSALIGGEEEELVEVPFLRTDD